MFRALQDGRILWDGTEEEQYRLLRELYDCTVGSVKLGDWDLGYHGTIESEDGISALLDMCQMRTKAAPALPLLALLTSCGQRSSNCVDFTRIANILIKLAIKYVSP